MSQNITSMIDRAFIFVASASVGSMNSQAALWDPDAGGGNTFGDDLGLSATGTAPATHWAANTGCTATMKTAIAAQDNRPTVAVYFESDGWTYASALADQGLQRVEP